MRNVREDCYYSSYSIDMVAWYARAEYKYFWDMKDKFRAVENMEILNTLHEKYK